MTTRLKLPSRTPASSKARNVSTRSKLGSLGGELTAFARSSKRMASSRNLRSWAELGIALNQKARTAKTRAHFIADLLQPNGSALRAWEFNRTTKYAESLKRPFFSGLFRK